LILPVVAPTPAHGRIVCRERLGGLEVLSPAGRVD
jgi:hypothetical protein